MFFAAFIVILIWGIGVRIRLNICNGRCYVTFSFLSLGRELPLHIRIRAEWSVLDGIRIFQIEKKGKLKQLVPVGQSSGKKRLKELVKAALPEYEKWLALKGLNAEGSIGLKADAFHCVMFAGALNAILKNSFEILLKTPETVIKCAIRPVFDNNFFLLKLEGMFQLYPVQIITAALKRYFPKRGIGSYVSSHRKHHENNYGAD